MGIPVELIGFVVLLLLGYFVGRFNEQRHFRSIREREDDYRALLVLQGRTLPPQFSGHEGALVSGNVAISLDYFKRVLATLRNLVGGRVSAYESLMDRARREAVLRMQAQARELGAEAVFNLRFATVRLSANAKGGLGAMEVYAYGTALIPRR